MEDVTRVNKSDRKLGMGRPITRRDFLNGVSVGIGGAMLASQAGLFKNTDSSTTAILGAGQFQSVMDHPQLRARR